MSMHPVLFIMTGGTIDSHAYDETPERVTPLAESLIPSAVAGILGDVSQCRFVQWRMKDSNDLTHAELDELAQMVIDAPESEIIITQGTDTTAPNARFIQCKIQHLSVAKTVILTGAMQPLLHGERSDAEGNLRLALAKISTLARTHPGVYIVGREEITDGVFGSGLFEPAHTEKDKARKIFVRIPAAN